jgi:SAM-dependent methyltransferase
MSPILPTELVVANDIPPRQPNGAYALGDSPTEQRRLDHQATILRPFTQRLLSDAGVSPGMHVVAVGCGTGDVALQAAELVGPGGLVTAVDRSPAMLDAVLAAAARRSLTQVRVVEADIGIGFEINRPADVIVGRLVLAHQKDPVRVLQRLVPLLTPGGVVCFLELCISGSVYANPARPLMQQVVTMTHGLFAQAGMQMDIALHLPSIFHQAGLPMPAMWLEKMSSTEGLDHDYIRWILDALAAVHPAPPGLLNTTLEKLDQDLHAEAREAPGPVCVGLAGAAWTEVSK